jgi:LssY C-terminus
MTVLCGICRRLAPLAVVFCTALAFGCDGLAAGQTLWVRLSAPVSSYSSKPGDIAHAVLIEAVTCDNGVIFPVGTSIDGTVHSVRKVGWGIRHETAALDIRFDHATVPEGSPTSISASVVEVENAREQVTSKGIIQGIRSSDTPEGRINSRLIHLPTYNPYSDLGLIVYKATFPIFPEPEIYYPAGTDLRLKLTNSVPSLPVAAVTPAESMAETSEELDVEQMAPSLPSRTTTVKLADADVVNLAIVGSREQVEAAFRESGWSTSDPFSKRTFVRTFYAFLNDSTYDQAPMKTLLLDGKPADMNWQKSLNSYNRRDHLRMWQWSETSDSEIVWLSSSTHDTRATLSVKQHQFVHHIAPDIDDERSTVIRDLELAGCVKSLHLVPRHSVPNFTQNANGDTVRTDGELAIVQLKECQPLVPGLQLSTAGTNFKAGNDVFRYLRKQILTFRSDIWRANIIYGAYDLTRMTIETFRHHPTPPPTQQAQTDAKALQMGGSE